MSVSVLYMSMSLDGYIAGPNDEPDNPGGDDFDRLHEWFGDFSRPSGPVGELFDEMNAYGAILVGRRTAEQIDHWGGDRHGVPIFVPSHRPPGPSVANYPLVTYVTDGIESAMAQAKAAAGDRYVLVQGAYTAQRALEAGVLDEVQIHQIPVLFGGGRRLFEELPSRVELEIVRVIDTPEATHIRYRVRRRVGHAGSRPRIGLEDRKRKDETMGKTIMGAVVSLDGFIADDNDDVGPLFDWYGNGDVTWSFPGTDDESRSTQASADFMRSHYRDVAAVVIGRRLFDLTNGWDGKPAAGEHVFVVTHQPPTDWEHADTAPFTFVDDVEKAIAAAKEFAGDRDVDVAAGQIGSQALKLGLIDQVVVNQVPVVFGSGRPFFATGGLAEPLRLENPTTIVRGDRVTHLVYDVSR